MTQETFETAPGCLLHHMLQSFNPETLKLMIDSEAAGEKDLCVDAEPLPKAVLNHDESKQLLDPNIMPTAQIDALRSYPSFLVRWDGENDRSCLILTPLPELVGNSTKILKPIPMMLVNHKATEFIQQYRADGPQNAYANRSNLFRYLRRGVEFQLMPQS